MRALAVVLMCLPGMAAAQDWVRQDDAGIMAALGGKTVRYDAYTIQHFSKAGDTQYITERAADGRWAARAGQYCSVWPPSDTWTCYDFYLAGDLVQFIGSDRSVSQGTILK
ncbi:hypothetical protein AB3Y40_05830 [Yoonia sp. R2331]|uniref:hypothetical protein n=1 Tax=Yoonia sp. R2331 TaxID=3237238 RepID=UPI0034E519B0